MTLCWPPGESRRMHDQSRHQPWYTNSIFDSLHVLNNIWLLEVIPWSFDLMEKSWKINEIFLYPNGYKKSHVENYSFYVGYSISPSARWIRASSSLVGRLFVFFVDRSSRGRKISQFCRLRAAPSTIEPLIWVSCSQSLFGLWCPSLLTISLR